MRVTITGATGLIGSRLVARLRERGDEVTALATNPDRARAQLGVDTVAWRAQDGPPPVAAIAGRDAVVNLSGAPIFQRWTDQARRQIRDSRITGTRHLVAALRAADPPPRVLVSGSAVGYYGPHGPEEVDEATPPGRDFLAGVCVEWERAADEAAELGLRVVTLRTGIVLDVHGGLLKQLLLPFKLGVGGPIAGGNQYVPWIESDDEVGLLLAALDNDTWSGPINAAAPQPVTNRQLAQALGRALHRPAVLPLPGLALKVAMGEMSALATTGQRVVPRRALELGYRFRYPQIDGAIRAALSA